jgi:hypothetical protein
MKLNYKEFFEIFEDFNNETVSIWGDTYFESGKGSYIRIPEEYKCILMVAPNCISLTCKRFFEIILDQKDISHIKVPFDSYDDIDALNNGEYSEFDVHVCMNDKSKISFYF